MCLYLGWQSEVVENNPLMPHDTAWLMIQLELMILPQISSGVVYLIVFERPQKGVEMCNFHTSREGALY